MSSTLALMDVEVCSLETDSSESALAVRLQGADNGKRNEMDFYPTPAACTLALLDYIQIPKSTTCWEPCSGDGAISKVLESEEYTVYSADLRQDVYGEGGVNFLSSAWRVGNAIVTNPPFNIAEDFIRHAHALQVPLIAMLLKAQYFHAADRIPLFRAFPPTAVLALSWRPCFRPELKAGGTMDFSWFVWDKSKTGTIYNVLDKPKHRAQTSLFAEEAA